MNTLILTAYILMWPLIVAGVLFVISRAFLHEWVTARKHGRDII